MKHRKQNGSMLFLMVCLIALIFVPVLMLISTYGPWTVFSGRAQNTVEAAAKVAASDLSRIVINDEEFGYVSLSNHQPLGRATRALDGEPLPVTGVNTIVGTLRQNAIIAENLQNETMRSLVAHDYEAMQHTIKSLNSKLADSINRDTPWKDCVDIDGIAVNPGADVDKFLAENLPRNLRLKAVRLSLGWLKDGSDTIIPVPQPVQLAQVKSEYIKDGKYEAFTHYPVAHRDFTFAGLGEQAHIVSAGKFRSSDGKHICSIIRLECTLVSRDAKKIETTCVACCQAFSHPDQATRGAMTLRFSGRPVPGLLSWGEFLSEDYFHDNRVTTFDIVGGDYPFDKEARMQESVQEAPSSTSKQFAEHLYFWLRNSRMRPRIDAVLAMVNEPFRPYLNEVYTFEFAGDGSITRKISDGNKFTRSVTADGQVAAMADTRIRSGACAVILFRDNVMHQSTDSGKHAGQPLAGYPLSNSETGFVDHQQLALNFGKRSNYSDGLALDIEIGGTGDSTARNDINRMRQRTMSRRI